MGMCLEDFGRISIEVRRESFIIHPSYGYDDSGNQHSDRDGDFGVAWRESAHPEFNLSDLDDLIKALEDARDYVKGRKAPTQLLCSVCQEPQFKTPSGAVCKNGHGGAPGVEKKAKKR